MIQAVPLEEDLAGLDIHLLGDPPHTGPSSGPPIEDRSRTGM